MTREEAITNLNMISVAFVEPVTKEQRKLIDDTFETAIKALEQNESAEKWYKLFVKKLDEQEPTKREIEREYLFQSLCEDFKKLQAENDDLRKRLEQEPCTDAVSRQAVLEMAYDMSEIDGEHFTEPCMVVDVEDIQNLPPVNPQPCDDAISREAVLLFIEKVKKLGIVNYGSLLDIATEVRNLPPVTQKSGHWIRITNGAMKEKYICSECGRQIEDDGIESLLPIKYPYCHCGARMVEPQERSDKE